jgi:sugar-specific transcriptional regulator TrmB
MIIIVGLIIAKSLRPTERMRPAMQEEDVARALEVLGLTGKEARAFLCLVRNGVSTAQRVSQLLGVQYPAVYRLLQSLQSKGWIEVSQERPNRYRARAPRIVAEEARQSRNDDLVAAAEVVGDLRERMGARTPDTDGDLWIYKGPENVGRKLREITLASNNQILCVSPFPVAPDVLRLLCDALSKSRRLVRVVLNEGNREDLPALSGGLSRNLRVQFRFPARPLPKTRLAHSYVFPSDQEVFILNSFYRDGVLVADKLQGLWVGDMDFVRIQLEAMLENLGAMEETPIAAPKTR